MSVRVMSAIWELSMLPTDKLVMLALADCANDEGWCWPSIATVARKSGVCERSVQRAIRRAEQAKLIARTEVRGKGCKYLIDPRHTVTPDTVSPATHSPSAPDTVSPKPSRTINTSEAKASSGKRATSFQAEFAPKMSGKTLVTVAAWEPGRLEDELEHFADHHTAKGTRSFDWQASWRTWVKNSKKWEPKNGSRYQRDDRDPTTVALELLAAQDRTRENAQAGGPNFDVGGSAGGLVQRGG